MNISRARLKPFHLLLRAQLLLFETPRAATWSAIKGKRLLLIFVAVEAGRKLLEAGSRSPGLPPFRWWTLAEMTLFVALALLAVVRVAELRTSDLGLYGWRRWSTTEKIYLLSTIPLAVAIFSFANWSSLKVLWTRPDAGGIALFVFTPEMIWGFYQELVYRGILQSELVRRWGTLRGIGASNLIFTFGPLHAYHFLAARRNPTHLWIFAAVFAIGLFFAAIFKRSGNLWIVGVLHGLGDWYLGGLGKAMRAVA